jgi:hypothetical protein
VHALYLTAQPIWSSLSVSFLSLVPCRVMTSSQAVSYSIPFKFFPQPRQSILRPFFYPSMCPIDADVGSELFSEQMERNRTVEVNELEED